VRKVIKSKNAIKSKSGLGFSYEPLVFNANSENMDNPVSVTPVGLYGWNPGDITKFLYADDLNIFMFRTNFSGDSKVVKNITSAVGYEITGAIASSYFYNINFTVHSSTLYLDIGSFADGTKIKIYNSGIYTILISSTLSVAEKFLFPGYLAEVTIINNITPVVLFSMTPTDGVPVATTGQIIPWIGTSEPSGFIPCTDGTIGNTTSGATILADYVTKNLYISLWNSCSDTYCPVSGGRGANAIDDFDAFKPIALPNFSGNAIVVQNGSSYTPAQTFGSAVSTIAIENMPAHTHPVTAYARGDGSGNDAANFSGGPLDNLPPTGSTGGGVPLPILPPSIAIPHWIKL
jgi:hypothetical protein